MQCRDDHDGHLHDQEGRDHNDEHEGRAVGVPLLPDLAPRRLIAEKKMLVRFLKAD